VAFDTKVERDMNLDERIESAWKEHCSVRYYATERGTDDAEDEFKSGYRAAMRSLYVEVKPEEVKPNRGYDFKYKGEWYSTETTFSGGVFWMVGRVQISPSVCDLIVQQTTIPSPAEIF
jgi:hypothetical protein